MSSTLPCPDMLAAAAASYEVRAFDVPGEIGD